jgi:hypothetical protein
MTRVVITDAMRAAMLPFATCDHCGDDMDIHEWVDVEASPTYLPGDIVNCDRAN